MRAGQRGVRKAAAGSCACTPSRTENEQARGLFNAEWLVHHCCFLLRCVALQYTQREIKSICTERGLTSFILGMHEDAAVTRFARVVKESLRAPGAAAAATAQEQAMSQSRTSSVRTKFGATIPVHMQMHFIGSGDGEHVRKDHTELGEAGPCHAAVL